MKVHLVLGLVLCLISEAQTQQRTISVATLWKAHGLESIERIKKIRSDVEKVKESREKNELALKLLIEFAFASHVGGELEKIVHKITEGTETFHLLIQSESKELLDVAYIYDVNGDFIGARLDKLPSNWRVLLNVEGKIFVDTNDLKKPMLGILFDLNEPFKTTVLTDEKP
jgi:hypothetical protein